MTCFATLAGVGAHPPVLSTALRLTMLGQENKVPHSTRILCREINDAIHDALVNQNVPLRLSFFQISQQIR